MIVARSSMIGYFEELIPIGFKDIQIFIRNKKAFHSLSSFQMSADTNMMPHFQHMKVRFYRIPQLSLIRTCRSSCIVNYACNIKVNFTITKQTKMLTEKSIDRNLLAALVICSTSIVLLELCCFSNR